MPVENLALKGILLNATLRRALVVSPSNPQGRWLDLGAEVEGWKLEEITTAAVRLAREQHSTELRLYTEQPAQ
jgi:hypothetical protein